MLPVLTQKPESWNGGVGFASKLSFRCQSLLSFCAQPLLLPFLSPVALRFDRVENISHNLNTPLPALARHRTRLLLACLAQVSEMLGVKQPTAAVAAKLIKHGVTTENFCHARFLKLTRFVPTRARRVEDVVDGTHV